MFDEDDPYYYFHFYIIIFNILLVKKNFKDSMIKKKDLEGLVCRPCLRRLVCERRKFRKCNRQGLRYSLISSKFRLLNRLNTKYGRTI